MIRFNCPNCGRRYEVPAALAHVPLLCKGCGQPLAVPERSTVEPEPPEPVAPPPSPKKPEPPAIPPKGEDDRPFLIPEPAAVPEARVSPPPAPPPTPAAPSTRRNLVPVVVDVAVGLVLLAVGVWLGEALCRKSTRQVWHDAGGAVRFPPVELLMWAAPPVLVLLVYGLLASRGISVGGWLKRRAA